MDFKEVLCLLFICFLALGDTKSCTFDSGCSFGESCCTDKVCRERCYVCSYDYQCGTSEQCCTYNSKCISSSSSCSCSSDYQCDIGDDCCGGVCLSTCGWKGGSIAGATIGTIIFFAIIISIASCCCCACCPYYRYRTPGAVVVAQRPQQQFISAQTHTMMTQQVQAPHPLNYNQPPVYYQPPPVYNQPPPAYLPPGPTPYPPAEAQGQAVSIPPSEPAVKY
ncbi:protein shisa-5-like [Stylophora pistillata]|uniref:protein shisa-5-like n=1 Tax=Stylophora pistillata TaxID=50429 RepID=UPI000C04E887|nr:protein shisa-5-like [Stylophora pistillata]